MTSRVMFALLVLGVMVSGCDGVCIHGDCQPQLESDDTASEGDGVGDDTTPCQAEPEEPERPYNLGYLEFEEGSGGLGFYWDLDIPCASGKDCPGSVDLCLVVLCRNAERCVAQPMDQVDQKRGGCLPDGVCNPQLGVCQTPCQGDECQGE